MEAEERTDGDKIMYGGSICAGPTSEDKHLYTLEKIVTRVEECGCRYSGLTPTYLCYDHSIMHRLDSKITESRMDGEEPDLIILSVDMLNTLDAEMNYQQRYLGDERGLPTYLGIHLQVDDVEELIVGEIEG